MILNLILGVFFLLIGLVSMATVTSGKSFSGGRSAGLGGASVGLCDFWSLQNNQAGLTSITSVVAGCAVENKFLLSEISWVSAGVVFPVKRQVFGLSFQQYGYVAYREAKAGLAYARSFGERFSVGIQLDYLSISIAEGYGRSGGVTFEVGFQVMLSDDLLLGVHAFNPLGIRIAHNEGEKAQSIFKIGMRYKFTDQLFVSIETKKEYLYKPSVCAGLEYDFSSALVIRVGYNSLPPVVNALHLNFSSEFNFGVGILFRHLTMDVAASVNTTMGWSPAVSVHYTIGKDEKRNSTKY